MNFPEIEISKQYWINFLEISLSHRETLTLRKTEISGKFLDEFSRICQYGLIAIFQNTFTKFNPIPLAKS